MKASTRTSPRTSIGEDRRPVPVPRLTLLVMLMATFFLWEWDPGAASASVDGLMLGAADPVAEVAGKDGGKAAAGEPTVAERVIASPFLQQSGLFILAALAVAQMLAVIRLMQGPTLADRVIALDFIGVTCASMIGVYSVMHGEPLFLRAAIVLSLMGFLGTIGFALYCEKRGVP